jgi:predicted ArsR family transcriptional regulator
MAESALSDAKRKIVDLLKRQGPATAADLAAALGLTDVAIRQHLLALESSGLARPEKLPASGRGRPALCWTLTDLAASLFPDRHSELVVGLLESMQSAFGPKGLERVIETRADEQVRRYRSLLPPASSSLQARVEALARQRTAEGYMAEVVRERPGCYLLIEHHCPICVAAQCCLRLCSAELDVFQKTLGAGVSVERTSHLLSGDPRCAYRICKR